MSEIILPDYKNMVSSARVYDLEESLIAAGYAMRTEKVDYSAGVQEQDLKRAARLINALKTDNQAHGQFLSGIHVNFDLTFSNKMSVELERYKFISYITSQSTIHRITKFNLDDVYDSHTDPRIIDIMQELINDYNELVAKNKEPTPEFETEEAREIYFRTKEYRAKLLKEKYLNILYSNPSGFKLTARLATNYRCLRNVYSQRKEHKLEEWRDFCGWIETLPYAEQLLTN